LIVPTTPSLLWLFAGRVFPPPALGRDEPLRERDALLRRRVDAEVFELDEPPEERDEPLRDELLLLGLLREADLLVAIADLSLWSRPSPAVGLPALYADNRNLRFPRMPT